MSECNHESSIRRRPWPIRAVAPWLENVQLQFAIWLSFDLVLARVSTPAKMFHFPALSEACSVSYISSGGTSRHCTATGSEFRIVASVNIEIQGHRKRWTGFETAIT